MTGHTSAIRAKKVLATTVYDTQGNRNSSIEELARNDATIWRDRVYSHDKARPYWTN